MQETSEKPGEAVAGLISSQKREWDLARDNYRALAGVMIRNINLENGCMIKVQFNPSRIRSTAAKVDDASVRARSCFLCKDNLPIQQKSIMFEDRYLILVNPFPIFDNHLTIALREHQDQLILGKFEDMLRLAKWLEGFVVFYNGPRCGASAPDHFHFQAGNTGLLPIEGEYGLYRRTLSSRGDHFLLEYLEGYARHTLVLSGNNMEAISMHFERIYYILQEFQGGDNEPMMNILAGYFNGLWRIFLFPRRAHRPVQFFRRDDGQVLISPASVDFGGVWIAPRREDFEKLDGETIFDIFRQVTLDNEQWEILKTRLCSQK